MASPTLSAMLSEVFVSCGAGDEVLLFLDGDGLDDLPWRTWSFRGAVFFGRSELMVASPRAWGVLRAVGYGGGERGVGGRWKVDRGGKVYIYQVRNSREVPLYRVDAITCF